MHLSHHLKQIAQFEFHWQYLYQRRRRWHGVSTAQIVVSQLFTVIASVAAGVILDLNKEALVLLVGTLVLLPGIIDLAATLTGVLSTKIHHQLDTTNVPAWVVIAHALLFTLFVTLLAGAIVGAFGGLITQLFFGGSFLDMVVLAVVSMSIIGVVCYPVMVAFMLLLRRFGLNPDNIAGPVESSVVDIVAVVVVAVVAGWLS